MMKITPHKEKTGYRIYGHTPHQTFSIDLVNPPTDPSRNAYHRVRWNDQKRWVFEFGMYSDTRLMVWADNLEDALDEAVDWLAEHAKGLLADEEVYEAFKEAKARLLAEGVDEDDAEQRAYEEAQVDTLSAGNCGHYLRSDEWYIALEDATRTELEKYLGLRDAR